VNTYDITIMIGFVWLLGWFGAMAAFHQPKMPIPFLMFTAAAWPYFVIPVGVYRLLHSRVTEARQSSETELT
jgi:hypothetical protein